MAHILLPTDHSDQALKAATMAVRLFGAKGNRFTLVHTFNAIGLADPMVPAMLPDVQQVHNEASERFEARFRAACDLSGAVVKRIVAFGPLAGAVDEVAREQDIDLVVMSSKGSSGSLFGTNTTSVITGSRVPVLEIPEEVEDLAIERILFADDRSPIKEHSLDILANIAELSRAEVVIAHVAIGRSTHEQTDNSPILDKVFARVPHRSITAENDDVEDMLFELAARERIDLIAVLHRHTGLWESLFRSSTTRAVAMHSRIPVLALDQ